MYFEHLSQPANRHSTLVLAVCSHFVLSIFDTAFRTFTEKARKGLLDDDDDDAGPRGAAARDGEPGESAEPPLLPDGVDLSQFDDEDEDIAAAAAAASRGGGGGESSDDDSSDDEDDEDAELARELDLIRREREEAKLRAAQAEAAEAEAAAAASLARNPLMPMAAAQAGPTFGNDTPFGASGGVKRRWDDDVVVRPTRDATAFAQSIGGRGLRIHSAAGVCSLCLLLNAAMCTLDVLACSSRIRPRATW